MSLLWLFLVSSTMGAPQMSLDTRYQDIVNSFNRIKPSLQSIPTALGEFGQDFNSHLGQFGNSLGSKIGNIGSSLGNMGNTLESQMGNIGREVDAFGNRLEQTIHRQMDNIPNMLDRMGERFDTVGGKIGRNFHDFGQSFGSGLLDQFDRQMGSMGTFESDMFGSMFGGRTQAPWWKGENVCVERKVVEEEPENVKLDIVGNINFQMQVAQCKEGEGYYECENTQGGGGALQTFKVRYTCCHGFSLTNREGCTEVDLSPLEETIGELGGSDFLDLLVSTGLDGKLDNVTLFVPDNEAMDDFQVELEQLKQLEPSDNVVYNVDEGLLSYRRRKRNVMIVAEQDLPDIPNIVAGHIVDGFVSTRDIGGQMMVTSENSGKVRLTSYDSGRVVMANCARVTSRDNMATNGMVHMVDRVLRPAVQTVGEILAADQHFRTFVTSLEEHGLMELLDNQDGVTVFAPTDKAFKKLDSEGLGKVLGGGNCAREVLLTHVLPSVLCSGVVEESGVSVTNIAGRKVGLTMDDDGNVLVENIKLVMKDKMATNGVIHVIEEVIFQDSVKNVMEHLESKKAKKLLDLLETSGLGKTLETMSNITFFAPSEKALSELPAPLLEELGKDPKKLEEILLHHVTTEKKTSCDLTNNQQLDTLGGQTLRVNLHKHFGHSRPLATVQCARVIETNHQVCGGRLHMIDRVLTPPTGDLVNTLSKDHKQFASLLDFAGVAGEFSGSLHTILAPEDSAFDKLDDDLKARLFSDKEVAASVVRNHVLPDAICCAAVPRITGFFQLRLDRRSLLGHRLGIRRSHGGHIYVNQSAFTRCDVAATDGVLHSVAEVLLPPGMESQQTSRGRKGFWLF